MMRQGATAGERAAGEAAAGRVAAAAGLELAEALRRCEDPAEAPGRQPHRPKPKRPSSALRPDPMPPMPAEPRTVAEMVAAKARRQEWLKRRAAAEERRLRAVYAAQAADNAVLREEQARRDGEWAEARAR